jgi:hypothetical protein
VPGLPAWALALTACWGIQLLWVSFTRLATAMISCLLTSSTSPSQQLSVLCKQACEAFGLQVGESMMSCTGKILKQSCQVQVQQFCLRDKQSADLD